MSKGIPAITIGKFGGAELLDENSGWLYDGTDEESYIENLKNAVAECIQNLEEVKRRGINARKAAENYTWERKAEVYLNWYTALIQKKIKAERGCVWNCQLLSQSIILQQIN